MLTAAKLVLAGDFTSAVEVPEPGSTYYSIQDVPHGQVREVWYNSRVTGTWRHALVYLPPKYDAETKVRYPVLYLIDGGVDLLLGWQWRKTVTQEIEFEGGPGLHLEVTKDLPPGAG